MSIALLSDRHYGLVLRSLLHYYDLAMGVYRSGSSDIDWWFLRNFNKTQLINIMVLAREWNYREYNSRCEDILRDEGEGPAVPGRFSIAKYKKILTPTELSKALACIAYQPENDFIWSHAIERLINDLNHAIVTSSHDYDKAEWFL